MSNTRTYTWGEVEAQELLSIANIIPMTTDNGKDPSWAGNYIIALAEKIKAERAVISMNK